MVTTFLLAVLAAGVAQLQVSEKDLPRVPPTEPSRAASTIQIRDDFRVELAASEPLVASPVAIAFDENSRMYVVEMIDYSERRDEQLGRIKLLEDTDGDGKFDKATVFADRLPWPTAIACYDGGVFVGATPDILYLKDTSGKGTADVRRVVYTGFGAATAKLNVQQLFNSFTWGLDNRIHGALGGNASLVTNLAKPGGRPLELRNRDFSFDPQTFDIRAESGGGQFGITFDDAGNKFTCSNSRHIIADMYDEAAALRNPYYTPPAPDVNIAVDGPAAEIYRISPDEPWRVIRTQWRVAGLVSGPVEGGGRPSGYFSGAGGIMIYRGDAFPPEYYGNAFVTDCGANIVHRKIIRRQGLQFVAERAADERSREFFASRDNWCRPVALANAPDGTLYVVDMYRETIEHPWSLPPELKSRLDLNSGNDRGRIFRVAPTGYKQREWPKLGRATTRELTELLAHRNSWHRETAARLLYERRDPGAPPLLRGVLSNSQSAAARLHALNLLASFDALTREDAARALRDSDADVRSQATRLALNSKPQGSALQAGVNDPEIRVRYAAAFATTNGASLRTLAERDVESPWMQVAILSSARDCAGELLNRFANDAGFLRRTNAFEFVTRLTSIVGGAARSNELSAVLPQIAKSPVAMRLAEALGSGLARAHQSLSSPQITPFVQPLFARARAMVNDTNAAEAQRIAATRLLRFTSFETSGDPLDSLLRLSVSPALQMAAADSLVAFHDGRGVTNLLGRWDALAPQTRTHTISLLLTRPADTAALLDEVENNIVSKNEFNPADLQRLFNTREPVLRERAHQLFRRDTSSRADMVKQYRPALELKGDAQRGHKIFSERCALCHRVGNEGFFVGPDLASVTANGKEKLLQSILDPNAEVAAAYVAYTVETKSGDTYLAIVSGDNPQAVTLKMPSGEGVQVPRSDIATMKSSDKSMMPEGLESGLSVQQVADLLEFVATAKPGK